MKEHFGKLVQNSRYYIAEEGTGHSNHRGNLRSLLYSISLMHFAFDFLMKVEGKTGEDVAWSRSSSAYRSQQRITGSQDHRITAHLLFLGYKQTEEDNQSCPGWNRGV
jgi:hypothetical protein